MLYSIFRIYFNTCFSRTSRLRFQLTWKFQQLLTSVSYYSCECIIFNLMFIAHYAIGIGYAILVLIEWGFAVHFCFAEGKFSSIHFHCAHLSRFCSHPHLPPLCTIPPIQVPTLCSSGAVHTYRRPLARNSHLYI